MTDANTKNTNTPNEVDDSRMDALHVLEAARKHAMGLVAQRDYKNAIGDFLGALDADPWLATISPKEHGVHLIASNMANQANTTALIDSVKLPEVSP